MGITRRFQHIFQPDTLFSPSPFFSNARATPPRPPPVSLSPTASNLLCLPASANSRHKAIPRCSSCSARLSTRSFRPAPRLSRHVLPPPGSWKNRLVGEGHTQSLFDTFSRRFAWERKRNEFANRDFSITSSSSFFFFLGEEEGEGFRLFSRDEFS